MNDFGKVTAPSWISEVRDPKTQAPAPKGLGFAIITAYIVILILVSAMYSLWFYNKDNLVCSHGINSTNRICENTFEGYASVRVLRKSIV